MELSSNLKFYAAIAHCLYLSPEHCHDRAHEPIEDWDVSAITDMSYTFAEKRIGNFVYLYGGERFVGYISKWDVSRVTNMQDMFARSVTFNGDISKWNVGSVTTMRGMFYVAGAFNGDISKWDVSRVTTMIYMFLSASSFSQTLCGAWAVSKADKTQMFGGSKGKMCSGKSARVDEFTDVHV